jgi:hypothetical protein
VSLGEHGTARPLEWPERWPVVGPAVGALTASIGAATALAEGDGIAGTLFSALAITMVLVGARNYRTTHGTDA